MTCESARPRIQEAVDRPRADVELDRHVARCEGCRRYREQLSRVARQLGEFDPADRLDVDLTAGVLARTASLRRRRLAARWVPLGAACAAVLAVAIGLGRNGPGANQAPRPAVVATAGGASASEAPATDPVLSWLGGDEAANPDDVPW